MKAIRMQFLLLLLKWTQIHTAHGRSIDHHWQKQMRNRIAARPGKYIPKWSELESFLESEVNVRMHAERREGLGKAAFQGAPTSRKQQKQEFKKQNDHKKGKAPDSVRCPICQGGHYIYNCQQFIDMNLMARLNKVTELQLCVRCLWPVHSNACVNKRNNMDCLNCMPEKRRHNSKLCPNAKNSANAVLKASKQPRKRKQNDNGQQSNKRRKFNGNRPKSERPPAAAHKVSDWSPASNAMASMPKLPKPTNHGKSGKTVILATNLNQILLLIADQ